MTARRAQGPGGLRLPGLRFLLRHVHGQLHELHDRGPRAGAARQRDDPGRRRRADAPGQAGRHADHGAAEKEHPAPRHRHAGGLQERHRRGHGPGLLDQHRPPPAGHRPRGGHQARSGPLQRDQREDPQPLQAQPRGGPPHRGPGRGRRHPGRDEGDQQARRDRRKGTDRFRQDGGEKPQGGHESTTTRSSGP